MFEEATTEHTTTGEAQCDQHNRDKNKRKEEELNRAHERLLKRLLPFVYLQDQNLEPVALMETVAERLMIAAVQERMRRKYIHIEMAQEAAE